MQYNFTYSYTWEDKVEEDPEVLMVGIILSVVISTANL